MKSAHDSNMAPDAWPDLSPQDWDATVRALAPLSDLPAGTLSPLEAAAWEAWAAYQDSLTAMLDSPASGACP